MNTVIPKHELKMLMRRFINDQSRGISLEKFAELCGMKKRTFADVFVYENTKLTEQVQRRVSSAYQHWRDGNVRIMKRPDKTQYVDYRKTPQPVIIPHMGITHTPDGFKLSIGPRNRHDYSYSTLDDIL